MSGSQGLAYLEESTRLSHQDAACVRNANSELEFEYKAQQSCQPKPTLFDFFAQKNQNYIQILKVILSTPGVLKLNAIVN